jgi:flagellar assembly protein FliH
MASPSPTRRFEFDTVFDGEGGVFQPARKVTYSAAEVERLQAEAMAEGERRMMATLQGQTAQALGVIGQALSHVMPALAQAVHEHREASARLALAAAGRIADAALERFPEAPARAALDALSREIEAAPRLAIALPADVAESVGQVLQQAAETAAYAGQITVRADPSLPPAAFVFDWGDGKASYDPAAAAARVSEALEAALAAEGLHAEPLPPELGSPHG